MEIKILDIRSLKNIYRYRLKIGDMDQGPTDKELFILAWRCAVADGVVEEGKLDQYILSSGIPDSIK
jgi:hypothetical protein